MMEMPQRRGHACMHPRGSEFLNVFTRAKKRVRLPGIPILRNVILHLREQSPSSMILNTTVPPPHFPASGSAGYISLMGTYYGNAVFLCTPGNQSHDPGYPEPVKRKVPAWAEISNRAPSCGIPVSRISIPVMPRIVRERYNPKPVWWKYAR